MAGGFDWPETRAAIARVKAAWRDLQAVRRASRDLDRLIRAQALIRRGISMHPDALNPYLDKVVTTTIDKIWAESRAADAEACGICAVAFIDGDECLTDVDLGAVHAACCGPERESYVNLDTLEPIGPNDPIPTPWKWTAS